MLGNAALRAVPVAVEDEPITLVSANYSGDGTTIILAYSENLDETSVPATGDFTVTVSY
jgi:hypothetical protein